MVNQKRSEKFYIGPGKKKYIYTFLMLHNYKINYQILWNIKYENIAFAKKFQIFFQ